MLRFIFKKYKVQVKDDGKYNEIKDDDSEILKPQNRQ
jgi:hypothetical protein